MPRRRKDCPLPFCTATSLKKLSNHLVQVHGLVDPYERQRCLRVAQWSESNLPTESTLKALYNILGLLIQPKESKKQWIEL